MGQVNSFTGQQPFKLLTLYIYNLSLPSYRYAIFSSRCNEIFYLRFGGGKMSKENTLNPSECQILIHWYTLNQYNYIFTFLMKIAFIQVPTCPV